MSDNRTTASRQPATHEPSPGSGLGPTGECQAYGREAEWLRAILKRCEELTVVEEGDELEEALNALADIRGLIREVLNNPPPAFTAALSEVRGGQ